MIKNIEKVQNGHFRTKDYTLFRLIPGNRPISQAHVDELVRSYQQYGYLKPPVLINERYQIINGQHTFMAAQALGEWIYFSIMQGARLPEVHALNRYSKDWNTETYMNSFVSQNRPEYVQYKIFKDKYGFGHKDCQTLLSGTSGGEQKYIFWAGNFKATNYLKAVKYAERIKAVQPFYAGYKRSSFVSAMIHCFENPQYDHKRFLHKLTLSLTDRVEPLTDKANVAQCLAVIEGIYNNWSKPADRVHLRLL